MNMANSQRDTGSPRAMLVLVRKSAREAVPDDVLVIREASTGRAVVMLPKVWAVARPDVEGAKGGYGTPRPTESTAGSRPKVELVFYRKYTEALLRRYVKMVMEAGRVPSLLGRELFRGNVTSYKVHSFEDVVIFCLDVERCLAKLSMEEGDLIRRVALQEYTQAEAAGVLGVSLREVVRHYGATLDKLTWMFLEADMLQALKSCQ